MTTCRTLFFSAITGLLAACLCACSVYSPVYAFNDSDQPITILLELAPGTPDTTRTFPVRDFDGDTKVRYGDVEKWPDRVFVTPNGRRLELVVPPGKMLFVSHGMNTRTFDYRTVEIIGSDGRRIPLVEDGQIDWNAAAWAERRKQYVFVADLSKALKQS